MAVAPDHEENALSPLEQQVLDEYASLSSNLGKVRSRTPIVLQRAHNTHNYSLCDVANTSQALNNPIRPLIPPLRRDPRRPPRPRAQIRHRLHVTIGLGVQHRAPAGDLLRGASDARISTLTGARKRSSLALDIPNSLYIQRRLCEIYLSTLCRVAFVVDLAHVHHLPAAGPGYILGQLLRHQRCVRGFYYVHLVA